MKTSIQNKNANILHQVTNTHLTVLNLGALAWTTSRNTLVWLINTYCNEELSNNTLITTNELPNGTLKLVATYVIST